jgi:hypothetical protein
MLVLLAWLVDRNFSIVVEQLLKGVIWKTTFERNFFFRWKVVDKVLLVRYNIHRLDKSPIHMVCLNIKNVALSLRVQHNVFRSSVAPNLLPLDICLHVKNICSQVRDTSSTLETSEMARSCVE